MNSCPALGICIGCNHGYECVRQDEIDAWEKTHGKFNFQNVGGGWISKSLDGVPYNYDLKFNEMGPIEHRIGYTLYRCVAPEWQTKGDLL